MKLFKRQKDNQSAPPIPPELQQYYPDQDSDGGRNWSRIIPLAIIGVVGLAIIILLIIWAAGGFSGNNTGRTPNNRPGTAQSPGNNTPKTQPKNGNNPPKQGSSGQNNGTQPGQPKTTPNTNNGRQTARNGKNLSNTGPGDTMAAFALAAIAGAGLHHVYIRRRGKIA